jgi:GH25 family lysozyme M1 (1,4-beta-N-acetylmuramidase)
MLKRVLVFAALGLVACSSAPTPESVSQSSEAVTTICGAPPNGPIQGRDVSIYQGNFDWNAQKAAGVVFGYARMGNGTNIVDTQFTSNWSKMKAAGILRGAYQFFQPAQDEVAQANLMIQAVGQLGEGDLPCMIDVETTGGQSGATMASKIAHWLQLVEAGTGKPPIIYSGSYFWQDNVGSTAFGKTPFWIADYGPSCPLMPPGWTTWTFWQYSDGNGALDHDVFNGTLAQLQQLAAAPGPQYPSILHRGAVDINGDGKSDICGRAAAGVICEVDGSEVKGPAWSDQGNWDNPQYYSTIQFADVDGDGKGDLCARDATGIVCEISNGNGFGAEIRGPNWGDASGWTKPQYYSTIQFADVNGDGKADVCARAAAGIVCALSDGKGFPTSVTGPAWSDANGWSNPQYYNTIQLVDVNGDGKADVCGRAAAGIICNLSDGTSFSKQITGPGWSDAGNWDKPEYESTIRYADIDGDGKVDVCGRAAAGISCFLSDGNGFPTQIDGPAWSDANGWNASQFFTTIQFADIDGNGKADICARDNAGIICQLSDGKGFPTKVIGPPWSSAGGWDDPQYDSTIGFADIDNDGKDDVCARGWAGMQCALSTGTAFADPVAGAAWSNPNGWGVEQYYGTVRYGGALHKKPTPPTPPQTNDGGTNSDGGTNPPTGSSVGCSMSADTSDSNGVAWLAIGLALVAASRFRASARRSSYTRGAR